MFKKNIIDTICLNKEILCNIFKRIIIYGAYIIINLEEELIVDRFIKYYNDF